MWEQEANFNRTKSGKLFVNTPEYKELKEKSDSHFAANDKYTNFYGEAETSDEFFNKLLFVSAAAIKTDSIHRDEETVICEEICRELKLDWDKFKEMLDKEIEKINTPGIESIERYLKDNLEIERNSRNALVLFEAALHIILADGMMTESECEFLADIGELLQIPTSKMFARIGLFLRQEKEVVVAPPENFDWLYGGESDSDFY
jgi:uncharacterized tellurite resistance protein B-like protein